jgi:hypothetical protein
MGIVASDGEQHQPLQTVYSFVIALYIFFPIFFPIEQDVATRSYEAEVFLLIHGGATWCNVVLKNGIAEAHLRHGSIFWSCSNRVVRACVFSRFVKISREFDLALTGQDIVAGTSSDFRRRDKTRTSPNSR